MRTEASETAAEFLRRVTHNSHHHAETDGFLGALLAPELDGEKYLTVLERLIAALSPIELALRDSAFLPKFPSVQSRICEEALRRDLLCLRTRFALGAHSALDQGNINDPVRINSLAAAAGALYVVEGSANGGKFLCRILQKRLSLTENNGLAYFSLQSSSAELRFPAFIRELNTQLMPGEFTAAGAYANEVFRSFT